MITFNDYYYGHNAHESWEPWTRGMEWLSEIAATPIGMQSHIRPIRAMTAAELKQQFASFASPTIRVPGRIPRLGEPSRLHGDWVFRHNDPEDLDFMDFF